MQVESAFDEPFPLPQPRIGRAAQRLLEQREGAVLFSLGKCGSGQLAERFRIGACR
jgi:hypothetical protein